MTAATANPARAGTPAGAAGPRRILMTGGRAPAALGLARLFWRAGHAVVDGEEAEGGDEETERGGDNRLRIGTSGLRNH